MKFLIILLLQAVLLSEIVHSEKLPVTYGSTIKLQHVTTKFRLHSHGVGYSRGSQQQSVTAYPEGDDGNSLWVVNCDLEKPCPSGQKITKGSVIRLQHMTTRRWLHSHHFQSPLTNNLEVSGFGADDQSDAGDRWVVDWDGKDDSWRQSTKVRLRHVDTQGYLSSNSNKFGNPIAGQQEVCGVTRRDKNIEWFAAEGVYYPLEEVAGKHEEL